MATNLKELRKKVNDAQKEHDEWVHQLGIAKQFVVDNPSEDAQILLGECESGLEEAKYKLKEALEQLAPLQDQLPEEPEQLKEPEPDVPKFNPQNHPVLKKAIEKTEAAPAIVLNTGDMCEAVWPRDKKWYKAKIMLILGSASAPKYKVKYTDYADDEQATVERDQVRPLPSVQHKKKREEAVAVPVAPVTSTPHVISGPASVNPNAQIAPQEVASDAAPAKKRKIPNRKNLEKSVGSWKDWNSKGVGKKLAQRDSMFRSGTTVESRVGFTGSGAGMTQSTKRVRPDTKAFAKADGVGDQGNENEQDRAAKRSRYDHEPIPRSSGRRF